jgi:hypothetical protein
MSLRTWLAAGALLLIATPLLAASPSRAEEREVLPAGLVPQAYDLLLSPDAQALDFKGRVGIEIDVAAPTREIVLTEKLGRPG